MPNLFFQLPISIKLSLQEISTFSDSLQKMVCRISLATPGLVEMQQKGIKSSQDKTRQDNYIVKKNIKYIQKS